MQPFLEKAICRKPGIVSLIVVFKELLRGCMIFLSINSFVGPVICLVTSGSVASPRTSPFFPLIFVL